MRSLSSTSRVDSWAATGRRGAAELAERRLRTAQPAPAHRRASPAGGRRACRRRPPRRDRATPRATRRASRSGGASRVLRAAWIQPMGTPSWARLSLASANEVKASESRSMTERLISSGRVQSRKASRSRDARRRSLSLAAARDRGERGNRRRRRRARGRAAPRRAHRLEGGERRRGPLGGRPAAHAEPAVYAAHLVGGRRALERGSAWTTTWRKPPRRSSAAIAALTSIRRSSSATTCTTVVCVRPRCGAGHIGMTLESGGVIAMLTLGVGVVRTRIPTKV